MSPLQAAWWCPAGHSFREYKTKQPRGNCQIRATGSLKGFLDTIDPQGPSASRVKIALIRTCGSLKCRTTQSQVFPEHPFQVAPSCGVEFFTREGMYELWPEKGCFLGPQPGYHCEWEQIY